MDLKKFITKCLILFIILASILILPSALMDPYNIFHWKNIKYNGIEPNYNYIKTKYIITNPKKYNAFMFGSSRVGAIHVENINDIKVYNMQYSVGVPAEHFNNIKTFLNSGVNIKRVYIGIDNISYTATEERHRAEQLRSSYEYLSNNPMAFFKLYINPFMLLRAIKIYESDKELYGYKETYTYGWWADYDLESSYDWNNAKPTIFNEYNLDGAVEDIKEIVSLCDENDIELVLFTNPMYKLTFEAATKNDYMLFLEKIAKIHGFYNFSGINNITIDSDNYIDTSHYNAEIGDMMLKVFDNCFDDSDLYEQGFGWYVTEDNFKQFTDILEANRCILLRL